MGVAEYLQVGSLCLAQGHLYGWRVWWTVSVTRVRVLLTLAFYDLWDGWIGWSIFLNSVSCMLAIPLTQLQGISFIWWFYMIIYWKKEEKHTDIQYKSKPKYILWQHRTFHIPLWDKGHTTPEVFDYLFFFVKYTLFYVCSQNVIISIMSSIKWATGSSHNWVCKIFQKTIVASYKL